MSGRGPFGVAAPPGKPSNFKGSVRRLIGYLRAERLMAILIVVMGVASVALSVLGPEDPRPRDRHHLHRLHQPEPARWCDEVRGRGGTAGQGDDRQADLVGALNLDPGAGIDYRALGWVLMTALGVYIASSLFLLVQGRLTTVVVQRTVAKLRDEVEDKLSRLPLAYFDSKSRGEILSRVTNDIDNVAQTLQQTMSQLMISVLTVVGVLVMMFVISPLLALIALVTVPLAALLTRAIAKRSQPQFMEQWANTGKLNGHIEEAFTGHEVVKVFGRQEQSRAAFDKQNEALFNASFKAQFMSGIIQPSMMFISNINYVLVAVIGALRVSAGAISIGDVQAFIQYSRQFTQPLTQVASMLNLLQSGAASAERVFELLDEPEEPIDAAATVDPQPVRGPGRVRRRVLLVLGGHALDRAPRPGGRARADRCHRRPDRGGQDHADQPDPALLRRRRGPDHFGWTRHLVDATGRSCATTSASCSRTPGCSAARSARTSPTAPIWPATSEVVAAATAAHVDHFVRTLPDGTTP